MNPNVLKSETYLFFDSTTLKWHWHALFLHVLVLLHCRCGSWAPVLLTLPWRVTGRVSTVSTTTAEATSPTSSQGLTITWSRSGIIRCPNKCTLERSAAGLQSGDQPGLCILILSCVLIHTPRVLEVIQLAVATQSLGQLQPSMLCAIKGPLAGWVHYTECLIMGWRGSVQRLSSKC